MRMWFRVAMSVALLGLAALPSPVVAQQKTVKACQDEWRANKADNQAKGITEKAYVAQCRTGGPSARPASAPAAAPAPTPSAAAPAPTKTVKACQDEWRANKAAYQAAKITERAYVGKCRAGEAVALPTGSGAAPRSDVSRSGSRAAFHARSQTISDGRDVAPRGRRSVSDRSPGEISLSDRSRRVGESQFQDLPLCRL
jgi:hypothetical protein